MVVVNINQTNKIPTGFISVALGLSEPPTCNWFCRNIGGRLKAAVNLLGIPYSGAIGNIIDAFGTLGREGLDLGSIPEEEVLIVEKFLIRVFDTKYTELIKEGNALIFETKEVYDLKSINVFLSRVALLKAYVKVVYIPVSKSTKLLLDDYCDNMLRIVEKIAFDELNNKPTVYEAFDIAVSSQSGLFTSLEVKTPFTGLAVNYKEISKDVIITTDETVDIIDATEGNNTEENNTEVTSENNAETQPDTVTTSSNGSGDLLLVLGGLALGSIAIYAIARKNKSKK